MESGANLNAAVNLRQCRSTLCASGSNVSVYSKPQNSVHRSIGPLITPNDRRLIKRPVISATGDQSRQYITSSKRPAIDNWELIAHPLG